jgi:hypothetical protein
MSDHLKPIAFNLANILVEILAGPESPHHLEDED